MSIKIMNRAWYDSAAKGIELLLLMALADRCDDDGVCWPGMSSLAEKTKISTRQIMRLVKSLEAQHELFVMRGQGRRNTNWYLVTAGMNAEQIATVLISRFSLGAEEAVQIARQYRPTEPLSVTESAPKDQNNSAKMSPLFDGKGDKTARKGDRSAKKVTSDEKKGDIAMSLNSSYVDTTLNTSIDSSVVKVPKNVDPSLFLPINKSFTAMGAWMAALDQLKPDMPKSAFDEYLLAAAPERYEADIGRVVIRASDENHRDFLENRLTSTLNRMLAGMCYPVEISVQFVS